MSKSDLQVGLGRDFDLDNAYTLLVICLASCVQMKLQLSLVEQMKINVIRVCVVLTCERNQNLLLSQTFCASRLNNTVYNSKAGVNIL